MPGADDLVRSGRVMIVLLAGPSTGFIQKVFMVDGAAILDFNFGLVRIRPQRFVFASGRWFQRASGRSVFDIPETAPRTHPGTGLRYFYLDAPEGAGVGSRIISQRVLRSQLMPYGNHGVLKFGRGIRKEGLSARFLCQSSKDHDRVVDLLAGYKSDLLLAGTSIQVRFLLAEVTDDEHLSL